ncbi:hypothetical protein [Dokdonella fugitiva]|uniref:Uncharacterized protein n=1 Tax=Dokdonella fugitiva TaxID=328517 RepID=A0A4R2ICH5_9GAMM|nr:hypothetical protein [Dokdonella fugitiva]TCO41842.1 hypothetical protein EV148_102193 [Dokdonella fugitiva]
MRNHRTNPLMRLATRALPRRGIQLLCLAFALAMTGTAIAYLSGGAAAGAGTADAPGQADAQATPVLLPTVVVRAEPEIPTLATITVRAADSNPDTPRAPAKPRFLPVHAVTSFASAGSAGAGFGMPYYSFGKPLRHGTEE